MTVLGGQLVQQFVGFRCGEQDLSNRIAGTGRSPGWRFSGHEFKEKHSKTKSVDGRCQLAASKVVVRKICQCTLNGRKKLFNILITEI